MLGTLVRLLGRDGMLNCKRTMLVNVLMLASGIALAQFGNHISGEGIPNPNPVVTQAWGDLPSGRNWGSTAGVDIDPLDGHVWAYERCGASSFGGGTPINCDTNPVDPIFKFHKETGEVPYQEMLCQYRIVDAVRPVTLFPSNYENRTESQ